jgi:glucose-6-phosphate 1-dehydrogenase
MTTNAPTTICILGGAGDLAQKKLLPALYELFTQELLPTTVCIVGFARTERTQDEYRKLVIDALLRVYPNNSFDTFLQHVRYASGGEAGNLTALEEQIANFESEIGVPTNRLFYLAIPPSEYEATFTNLHKSNLVHIPGHTHFTRILVEKPFGNDYASAQQLDTFMSSLFVEEQIYRIDHYLAKEAVQNIIAFRFANVLLQTPYTKDTIEKVVITLFEKSDIKTRAKFYNSVGAIRDVGQNHILQILALVAMDEPKILDTVHIRKNRAAILNQLKPFSARLDHFVRAQYEGYTTEVQDSTSQTETYFEVTTYIDAPHWEGVPFILKAGKALSEDGVSVKIFLKDVATGPFETKSCATVGNSIEFIISPKQQTRITLNMKKPGRKYQVESKTLSYSWEDSELQFVNAYEKVLLDCIEGDQTVFTTKEEVLASWKYITSIVHSMKDTPLYTYVKGSTGPEV